MPYAYYLDNKLNDEAFGNAAFTPAATLYVALSTTTPTQAGASFTEPSGYAYARAAVINNATNWPASSNGSKSNGAAINFAQATGSWGTVTYFGIFDAVSGGNLLAYGALNNSQTVSNGDTLSFAVGALTITLN
jgi:hypothetical protein